MQILSVCQQVRHEYFIPQIDYFTRSILSKTPTLWGNSFKFTIVISPTYYHIITKSHNITDIFTENQSPTST